MTLTPEQLGTIKVYARQVAHDAAAAIWASASRDYLSRQIIDHLRVAVQAAGYTMQIAEPKEASNG